MSVSDGAVRTAGSSDNSPMASETSRRVAFQERRNFVAKAENAAGLEADHGYSARDVGQECGHAALRLAPRLVHLADRQERAAAAERARGARVFRHVDAIAGGGEHGVGEIGRASWRGRACGVE